MRPSLATTTIAFALSLAVAAPLAGGCSSQKLVALMPGVMNDPANRSLRRALMQFGADEFCREVSRRGAPLRMRDDEPIIGRFFAKTCDAHELAGGDLFVQFGGTGYAWSQPTGRVGFKASGAVQYDQDFLLDGSTMYAYFRPRDVNQSGFETLMVERVQQSPLGGLIGDAARDLANRVGTQLLAQELGRGFTVLRDTNGGVDFGLGIVEKGARPPHPFDVRGDARATLANDRVEVHEGQRDFVGPIAIEASGRALFVAMTLDGAPAVDVLVFRKDDADPWLADYIARAGTAAPPLAPVAADVVSSGSPWSRSFALPQGLYYLVVDNTPTAGRVAPPAAAPGGIFGATDAAALVGYVVQVGDAP